LPYSCNSVWSAPPRARLGSSVLSTTLSSMKPAQGFTRALLWEVGLLSPPFSGAGSLFHPTPAISVRLQFAVYAFQFC
jgi:hypothetical protein